MHPDPEVRSPTLAGGSELLVIAPVRAGFVPALDTLTYGSRARLLLAALHAGRRGLHEERVLRVMSDAVERVGVIHSLRVAVLDAEGGLPERILLSVNFDGSFEAYLRVIWQKAARLLDLIFCNTEGYPLGWTSSFETWTAWLRSVQVRTPFFYATPGVTKQDLTGLRMLDRLERRGPAGVATDLAATRLRIADAEAIAWRLANPQRPADLSDPTASATAGAPSPSAAGLRQAVQSLGGLYRLAEWYPAAGAGDVEQQDHRILLRGAQELLPELLHLSADGGSFEDIGDLLATPRLRRALAWLHADPPPSPAARQPAARQARLDDATRRDLQPAIADAVPTRHAVLCLIDLPGRAAAARLIGEVAALQDAGVAATLGFTVAGLRVCGLSEAELAGFPPEFLQGMAARAGLLGDVRGNHPRQWRLPRRNAGSALDAPDAPAGDVPRVELDAVHAVLLLREGDGDDETGARARLAALVRRCARAAGEAAGGQPRLLHVQWLRRRLDPESGAVIEPFGFADALSNPQFEPDPKATRLDNHVHLGELLLGHANAADPVPPALGVPHLQRNGSFWALRKMAQDRAAFEDAVRRALEAAGAGAGLDADTVRAKLMGRQPDGTPLVPHGVGGPNDFDYRDDPDGRACPLGSHIRRAHPRSRVDPLDDAPAPPPGARSPRIVRRSLPYGPERDAADGPAEQGLMFMAFNASLAEQFEVVQRWLAGGNGSGNASAAGCPLLGVPESGRRRVFRFEHAGRTVRVELDGGDALGPDPLALVTLRWGLYAFAPSRSGLAWLRQRADEAGRAADVPWSAEAGRAEIAALRALEASNAAAAVAAGAWKAALEDPESLREHRAASIWAAVREHHGGVLRVPGGVLVADRALVDGVLVDTAGRYSARGYLERLHGGLGDIYLGLDAGDEYRRLSTACNTAIEAIDADRGYADARAAARRALDDFTRRARLLDEAEQGPRWSLTLDLRDLVDEVLADLCTAWFGIDARGGHFVRGGFDPAWTGGPVPYPGLFVATSRATFQPWPEGAVRAQGRAHGAAIRTAMRAFLNQGGVTFGPRTVTAAVMAALQDPDERARTVAGAMMGFLPTADGQLRRVLAEWTRTGELARLRARHAGSDWPDANAALDALLPPLTRTMQHRPTPEMVWRTVVRPHRLGRGDQAVDVREGELVVLALVSATQQRLQAGDAPDVMPVFGGTRRPGGPTHACPGYRAALGVFAGVLAELVQRPEALRAGPAPGIVVLEPATAPPGVPPPLRGRDPSDAGAAGAQRLDPGEAGFERSVVSRAFAASVEAHGLDASVLLKSSSFTLSGPLTGLPAGGATVTTAAAPRGRLIAYGDSWLAYSRVLFTRNRDLGTALQALGWDVGLSRSNDCTRNGRKLAEMAAQPLLGRFLNVLREALSRADPPRAVLVSGGGNDFTGDADDVFEGCGLPDDGFLHGVVRERPGSPDAPVADPARAGIDDGALGDFLARVGGDLRTVLQAIGGAAPGLPVLVHAYDHPLPNGEPAHLTRCPLLKPVFDAKGWSVDEGRLIMAELIGRLQAAYAVVVGTLAGEGAPVHLAELAGTLRPDATHWQNEMHPNEAGFALLASKVTAKLDEVFAAQAAAPH